MRAWFMSISFSARSTQAVRADLEKIAMRTKRDEPYRASALLEHDLFGKPLYTFPDHALNPLQDDHRRRRGQRLAGHSQGALAANVDLERLADALHELVQRSREAVHRQYDRGAQA